MRAPPQRNDQTTGGLENKTDQARVTLPAGRYLFIRDVAPILGYAESTMRLIQADKRKPPNQRRFPETTHRGVPQMDKVGRCYRIWWRKFQDFVESDELRGYLIS